jgi:hypothetical protein
MADYYVWSGATGAATGADWNNAYLALYTAMTGKAAGDVFYVADDHLEALNSVAMIILSPGTETLPCYVYCMRRVGGSVPPVFDDLRTTAKISTINTPAALSLRGSVAECYGITFSAGTGAITNTLAVGNTGQPSWRLVKCSLQLGNTSSGSRIQLGSDGALTILEQTTLVFGNVLQAINPQGRVFVKGFGQPLVIGPTIPNNLVIPLSGNGISVFEGCDLSNMDATRALYSGAVAGSNIGTFKDCKLGGAGAYSAIIAALGGLEVTLLRCDTGTTSYRTEKHNRAGGQTTETTIVRSGGASDGVTPVSWKFVISTSHKLPFESLPISIWNETVGAPVTVTVQGIWSGVPLPTNRDIWIDVVYLGTDGPLGFRASSAPDLSFLAPVSTLPAGSGTWGGAFTAKFAMSVTVTPLEKGPITVYVMAKKNSSTFYIDPKPLLS